MFHSLPLCTQNLVETLGAFYPFGNYDFCIFIVALSFLFFTVNLFKGSYFLLIKNQRVHRVF